MTVLLISQPRRDLATVRMITFGGFWLPANRDSKSNIWYYESQTAMTTQASSNKTEQDKSEFIRFEDRGSDHPFVETVWRCHSERADSFLSVAANNFEMAITRLGGKSFLTLRGPETKATTMDCPAEGEWVCIRFKVGTFMPRFRPGSLLDHKDVTLPSATGRSFWLNGSALEYPDFENAETFVERLAKSGNLSRDRVVADTLFRRPRELSLRSTQRHFLRAEAIVLPQMARSK
jgi:hypothetical protein